MEVDLLMRAVGTPHKGLNVISSAELKEYIQYKYPSDNWSVQSHYLGEVKNEQGSVQGYRFAFVFTKYPQIAPTPIVKSYADVDALPETVSEDFPKKVKRPKAK